MSIPTFSLLIPTAGRPSLARALSSVAAQIGPGDECLVIGDVRAGALPESEAICREYPWCRYVEHTDGRMTFGHAQINHGLTLATGDYIHCQDDDDIYEVGALAHMRAAATEYPGRPLLFRFRSYHGGIVFWLMPGLLRQGCVGGHCAVFPNDPARLGKWGDHYEGDYGYVKQSIDNWAAAGVEPVWCEPIVAIQRPQ